jgi:hypothetical protein
VAPPTLDHRDHTQRTGGGTHQQVSHPPASVG